MMTRVSAPMMSASRRPVLTRTMRHRVTTMMNVPPAIRAQTALALARPWFPVVERTTTVMTAMNVPTIRATWAAATISRTSHRVTTTTHARMATNVQAALAPEKPSQVVARPPRTATTTIDARRTRVRTAVACLCRPTDVPHALSTLIVMMTIRVRVIYATRASVNTFTRTHHVTITLLARMATRAQKVSVPAHRS